MRLNSLVKFICNKLIFFIVCFSSLIVLGQQNEDLLNYANEIKIFDSEKAVVICESMLGRTHNKNCDAYEILIEANFILESYDQTLEYIYKLRSENCVSTLDQAIKLYLIEAEIYHRLDLQTYQAKVVQDLKNMLTQPYSTQEKTKINEGLEFYNSRIQGLSDKSSVTIFDSDGSDSFSFLFNLKEYGIITINQGELIDFRSMLLSTYPNLTEEYENIYFHNFSLIDALYYFNIKDYHESISILQKTLSFIESSTSHYYYKSKAIEQLTLNFIELRDEKSLLALRQTRNGIDQRIQDIETSSINEIIKYTNERNNKEYASIKTQNNTILNWLISFLTIVVVSGSLLWFRYYKQERQYAEIEKYFNQLKNKSVKKKAKVTSHTKISNDIEIKITDGLKDFEVNQEFLNNSVSLAYLASKLEVNTRYLSSFLNTQINESFSSYINRLRIEYIVGKLKNESKYLKYKISYLAEESGYTSHSSFTTAFKSVTGMSPTKFINYLKKK